MKYLLITICLGCFSFLSSCSTSGSYDLARIKAPEAEIIAETMMQEIRSYPRTSLTAPTGKPIYNAFNIEFEKLGLNVIETKRLEPASMWWQKNYVKIHTSRISRKAVLVQLMTPFYDVHQSFNIEEGEVYPASNPTLNYHNQNEER